MTDERNSEPVKLNLGCGAHTPAGWINVDYALGARLARAPLFRRVNRRLRLFAVDWDDRILIHDLTKPLPWKNSSVAVVYSSHTLEHFSREQGALFLGECHRVLRRDGVIRIVVPDLASCIRGYTEGRLGAQEFVESLGVLYGTSKTKIKKWLAPFIESVHKCMYDTPTLLKTVQQSGFAAQARKPFDSDISEIQQIELVDRTVDAVIVEGQKRP